jgi:hypothetical protein
MVTPLAPTSYNGANQTNSQFETHTDSSITVTSDTYVDIDVIYFSNYVNGLFTIENTHASNSLTYTIYGHESENGGTYPAASDLGWIALNGAKDIVVAAQANSEQSLTDRVAWLLIRMKRTSAGQSSAATLLSRCYKA